MPALPRAGRYYFWRIMRGALRSNDSPRQIAGGVAIGVFVGFTPTMGLHIITAAVAATLLRCSRIPAIAMVFINNPFTAIPIYAASYVSGVWMLKPFGFVPIRIERIKRLFVSAEEMGWMRHLYSKLGDLFALGWRGFVPLWLGCTVLGAVAAVGCYYMTVRFVIGYRMMKAEKLVKRARRRLERIRRQQELDASASLPEGRE